MFKVLIQRIRLPESQQPLWRWPLPFWVLVSYLVATLVGVLMVTTWREDDISDPDATSLLAAGIIGGLLTIWAVIQNIRAAIIEVEQSGRKQDKPLTVAGLLSLRESRSRPMWVVWLTALVVVIAVESLSLVIGRPTTSFPLGLDRIEDAGFSAWVLGGALFIIIRPIAETLIFCGLLYPVLAKILDDNLRAAFTTAGCFAVYYLVQVFNTELGWSVMYWGLVYPFALGLTISLVRAHTKSTIAAIGSHAMFGLFIFLSALVIFLD